MLTLVLLAALGSADPSQDQARRPVPPTGAYERTLPLADLLAEVPDDAWGPYPNRWTLTPATLELRRRAESGELSDDEWRTALIRADTIHTRKRWPAGQPLVLWVDQQAWLRMTEIRVRAVQPDLGEVSANNLPPGGGVVGVCGDDIDERKSKNRHLRLAQLPPGTKRVRFEVSILQGDAAVKGSNPRPAPKQLWHGFLELPIEAVPTAEEILLPTTEGSDAIRKALVAGLLKNTDDPPPAEPEEGLAFVVRGDYDDYPVLRGTGLSLSLELWHECGRCASRTSLRTRAISGTRIVRKASGGKQS